MIILGIDPGDTLIGFGILEKTKNKLSLINCGCINIPTKTKNKKLSDAEKLEQLEKQLTVIIEKHKPDIVGIEELFFFKNLKTAIKVAQARGVILATCQRNKIKILEFTPLEIKLSVTGYGRAEKKQVQKMVELILELPTPLKQDDTTDAIAIAICTTNSYRMKLASGE